MNEPPARNNDRARRWKARQEAFAIYAAKKHIPLDGAFELTPRCNLRCKMCYIRLDADRAKELGQELSADQWTELGKQTVSAGTLKLLLTGGEPMIRKDFTDIYGELSKMGFLITLNTNATMLTPELFKLLKKCPPTETNVTIYGASPETYEKVCGNPGAFDAAMRGLEQLSEISTKLEVRTTFIKDNFDELNKIRELSRKYTKRYAMDITIYKPVRGASSDAENCRMSPRQIFELTEANFRYYQKLSDKLGDSENEEEMTNQAEKEELAKITPKMLTCLSAKASYWITWDGKMLPCGFFTEPYTNPLEEGFLSAWNRLPGLYENLTLPDKCLNCDIKEYCSVCPAVVLTETGGNAEAPQYCCEITKEIVSHENSKKCN